MISLGFEPATLTVFAVLAGGLLFLDMFSHRKNGAMSLRAASLWSLFYVGAAVLFGVYLWLTHDAQVASLFFAGYTLEKVLSVDNLIVFGAVFAYFGVPANQQHRILYYGIFGAILFRAIFVAVGAGTLGLFGWVTELIFGLLIALSAYKMLCATITDDGDNEIDHDSRWYIQWIRKVFDVVYARDVNRFFVRGYRGHGDHRVSATTLLLCLVAVEVTDIMFAFDSIPTIIAVSQDPMIILTSMLFAMLGLRSLYFVLVALQRFMVHLEKAVIVVLGMIAAKLIGHALWDVHVDPMISLAAVLGVLGCGFVASWVWPESGVV